MLDGNPRGVTDRGIRIVQVGPRSFDCIGVDAAVKRLQALAKQARLRRMLRTRAFVHAALAPLGRFSAVRDAVQGRLRFPPASNGIHRAVRADRQIREIHRPALQERLRLRRDSPRRAAPDGRPASGRRPNRG